MAGDQRPRRAFAEYDEKSRFLSVQALPYVMEAVKQKMVISVCAKYTTRSGNNSRQTFLSRNVCERLRHSVALFA